MITHNFDIGDEIIVINLDEAEYEFTGGGSRNYIGWCDEMKDCGGEMGVVINVIEDCTQLEIEIPGRGCFWVHPDDIAHANNVPTFNVTLDDFFKVV